MPLGDLRLAKARQEEFRREAAGRARGTLITGSFATRWRSRLRRARSFGIQLIGLRRGRPPQRFTGEVAPTIGGDLPSGR
jgi:hypothetical protein